MEVREKQLNNYEKIECFIYGSFNQYDGIFAIPGNIGLMMNATIGTIFFLIDIFASANKLIPAIFLSMNIIMALIPFLYSKKYPSNNSFKYSFFLPGLYSGLSGVYSSIAFLFMTFEILNIGSVTDGFVWSYMIIVIFIYILIIIIQFIWYLAALKLGYYSYKYSPSKKYLTTIAKVLTLPVGVLYIAIAPFTYAFSRIVVHTVDSYPLQIVIFATALLILPFGCALYYPVFIWWYLVRKYRKYIPDTSWHK